MMETDNKRSLTKAQASELLRLQKRVIEEERYNPFLAFDRTSNCVTDLAHFSSTIKKKLTLYENLYVLANRIENQSAKEEE